MKEIHVNSYAANNPVEDTWQIWLDGRLGATFGVFDGHSGGATSAFARDELFKFLHALYARALAGTVEGATRRPKLADLLPAAFVLADYAHLNNALEEGRPEDGLAGACAVAAHVDAAGWVTVANAGDCRVVVGRRVEPSASRRDVWGVEWAETSRGNNYDHGQLGFEAVELSRDHQIDTHPGERERLLSEHLDESTIIRKHRVRGGLQPTRGLGDGAYKHAAYYTHWLKSGRDGKQNWRPPYTTSSPEMSRYKLSHADCFMVIGCDGLFQDLTSQQVVDVVAEFLAKRNTSGGASIRRAGKNLGPAEPSTAVLSLPGAPSSHAQALDVLSGPSANMRESDDIVTSIYLQTDDSPAQALLSARESGCEFACVYVCGCELALLSSCLLNARLLHAGSSKTAGRLLNGPDGPGPEGKWANVSGWFGGGEAPLPNAASHLIREVTLTVKPVMSMTRPPRVRLTLCFCFDVCSGALFFVGFGNRCGELRRT